MNPGILVLLGFLAGGGSGDLLDYVPTQSYWQDRSVAMTVDSMLREAAPDAPVDASGFIADLGSADPQTRDAASEKILALGPAALPQVNDAANGPSPEAAERAQLLIVRLRAMLKPRAVRRLMAIRTLGELEDTRALPLLQSLLTSDEMFVADYARAAIGRIEGYAIKRPSTSAARDDVWLLPANCAAVFQIMPRVRGPKMLEEALANVPLAAGQDRARITHDFSTLAISIAEQFGEMRLDALSIGISDDMDGDHGFVVVIASGQFDSTNADQLMRQARRTRIIVDGVNVFEPDGDSAVFFPSDHRLVMLASPEQEKFPLKEMIAAVKTNDPALKQSAEMTRLINSIEPAPASGSRALWAAIKVTGTYRQVPGLDGFQTATMWGDAFGGSLQLSARGEAADVAAAHAAVEELEHESGEAAMLMKVTEPNQPSAEAAETFFRSMKFQNDGNIVTGAASIRESPSSLLTLPILLDPVAPEMIPITPSHLIH
jgi:hypothetical protein